MSIICLNERKENFISRKGERKLNDIFQLEKDGQVHIRIYLNNSDRYVVIPSDKVMLLQIKDVTWTLDNKDKKSTMIKSGKDKRYLTEILKKFGYDEKYVVCESTEDEISQEVYKNAKKLLSETEHLKAI